jgi:hypothetical protein
MLNITNKGGRKAIMNIKFDKPREECCHGVDATLFRFTDFYKLMCKHWKEVDFFSLESMRERGGVSFDIISPKSNKPDMLTIALEPGMGYEEIALAFTRLYFETYHGGEIPIDALNKQAIANKYYWNPTSYLCGGFNLSLHMFYQMLDGLGIPRSREKIYLDRLGLGNY